MRALAWKCLLLKLRNFKTSRRNRFDGKASLPVRA